MKRKIQLLLSCLACCAMLTYGMLSVEAVSCTHTRCSVLLCAATGRVTFDSAYHYVEYGTQYVCADCGYTYYTDVFTEKHKHNLERVNEKIGEQTYSYFRCTGCNYNTKK